MIAGGFVLDPIQTIWTVNLWLFATRTTCKFVAKVAKLTFLPVTFLVFKSNSLLGFYDVFIYYSRLGLA